MCNRDLCQVVQSLLSCLDNPELPFLQWQECLSVLATRLPKELRNEVHDLLLLLHVFHILHQISLLYAHSHLNWYTTHKFIFHMFMYSDFILFQLETKYKEYQAIPGLQNLDFPAKILRGVLEVGSWSYFYPFVQLYMEFWLVTKFYGTCFAPVPSKLLLH